MPDPLAPVEAPAPLMVPGGVGPDETDRSGSIRSGEADLTPAPWWTTFTQSPLELTAEEIAAADLLAGRTPSAGAPVPEPLPAPVSARHRLRARLAASLSAPAPLAGNVLKHGSALPAPVIRAATRLAEVAAQASARAAAARSGTPMSPPWDVTDAQPESASASAGPAPDGAASTGAASTADAESIAAVTAARAAAGPTGPAAAAGTGAASAPGTVFRATGSAGTAGTARTAAGPAASTTTRTAAATSAGTAASSGRSPSVPATGPRPSSAAIPSGSGAAPPAGRPPGGRRPGTPRLLIWGAGGLLLILVLTAFFFLGRSLVRGADDPAAVATSGATADPSADPSADPNGSPTSPTEATAPLPVGVHPWDTLFGGECLQPYDTPWAEEFTVADCAAPHAAQLVYRGTFAGDAATAFPGEAELAGQINLLCSATGVIDLAAAAAYDDVQVQGSFPITEEQWDAEARDYYCFVSRASGEPLTASLAGPGPAPAA